MTMLNCLAFTVDLSAFTAVIARKSELELRGSPSFFLPNAPNEAKLFGSAGSGGEGPTLMRIYFEVATADQARLIRVNTEN
jgi:hypothetical protein